MIKYHKLFDLLNRRGMKKSDLLTILSSKTIAKLSKGANINTDVIDKICIELECQPSDIMEVVITEEDIKRKESVHKSFESMGKPLYDIIVGIAKTTNMSPREVWESHLSKMSQAEREKGDFPLIVKWMEEHLAESEEKSST